MLRTEYGSESSITDRLRSAGGELERQVNFRSGAVIGVSRIVLAVTFFLALWFDPQQPVRASAWGYALLLGYIVAGAGLLVVAVSSWWWDHRLAWPALILDVGVFLAAVFFTEGASDFTSPFLAFFAFLMLAATIRWGWRVTALVGLATTSLYLFVGLAMSAGGIELELYRFSRRVIYMLILSLVLVWFGLQRRERHVDRFQSDQLSGGEITGLLDGALEYAMTQCDAAGAAIAWAEDEEPWAHLRAKGMDVGSKRVGPEAFDPSAHLAMPVRLFDRQQRRQLCGRGGGRARAQRGSVDEPLAALLGVNEALALPLSGSAGSGELVIVGIRGPTADHVEIGEHLAREIEAAIDRLVMASVARSSAVAHTRDAVARDLHDSVAQALAGASFRLEGLRTWVRAGKDADSEIVAIQHALRTEQQHVRGLISRLRAGGDPRINCDLSAAFASLARDLSQQWGLAVQANAGGPPLVAPAWLAHEIEQLLREAVANAVRHGGATQVTFEASPIADGLALVIADDGRGFPIDKAETKPWSLHERAESLGGTMALVSGDGGTRIEIHLPLEGER